MSIGYSKCFCCVLFISSEIKIIMLINIYQAKSLEVLTQLYGPSLHQLIPATLLKRPHRLFDTSAIGHLITLS